MKDELFAQGKHAIFAILWAALSAITLERWVMILSALFLVLQLAYLERKWWREEIDWSRWRRGARGVVSLTSAAAASLRTDVGAMV
jgi:hypothetical protein